jgi:hypothetical protein
MRQRNGVILYEAMGRENQKTDPDLVTANQEKVGF